MSESKSRTCHDVPGRAGCSRPASPADTQNTTRRDGTQAAPAASTSTRGSRSRAPSVPSGRNPCVSNACKARPRRGRLPRKQRCPPPTRSRAPPRAAPPPLDLSSSRTPPARGRSAGEPLELAGGLGATAPRVRNGKGADARTHGAANIDTDAPGAVTAPPRGGGTSHRCFPRHGPGMSLAACRVRAGVRASIQNRFPVAGETERERESERASERVSE